MKVWLKKNLKWFVLAAFVLLNLFIIAESCVPGVESGQQSSWVSEAAADAINFFKPETINQSNWMAFDSVTRKIVGHYSLFLLDGILGFIAFNLLLNKKPKYQIFLITILVGASVALLTEGIQLLIPGRSGKMFDVGIDTMGYLTSTLILFTCDSLINIAKSKKASSN